jgi:hypothetical protein
MLLRADMAILRSVRQLASSLRFLHSKTAIMPRRDAPPALVCFVADVLRCLPPIGLAPDVLASRLACEGAIGASDFIGASESELAAIWPSLGRLPAGVLRRICDCAPAWAQRPAVEVARAAVPPMAKRARVEPPRAHDEPVTLSLVRDSIMVIVMAKETRRPPGGVARARSACAGGGTQAPSGAAACRVYPRPRARFGTSCGVPAAGQTAGACRQAGRSGR